MLSRVAGALLAGLILSACSSRPTEPRYLYPPAASCPPLAAAGEAVPLPADFRPVTAARCDFDPIAALRSPGPNGTRPEYTMYRSAGPLDALATALRLPPPTHDGGDLICTTQLERPVFLALTDGSGKTVVPAIPASPCGFRLPEVTTALQTTTWTEIKTR